MCRGRVVIVLLADVAPDAVPVPLLDDFVGVFVGPDDLDVVEPLLALYVPARWQHDDPAVLERGEVMLDAPAAERIVDAPRRFLARQERLGDEVFAVGDAEPVTPSVQRQGASREVPLDAGRRRRLEHLAVPAGLPRGVDLRVARRARLGADKR